MKTLMVGEVMKLRYELAGGDMDLEEEDLQRHCDDGVSRLSGAVLTLTQVGCVLGLEVLRCRQFAVECRLADLYEQR